MQILLGCGRDRQKKLFIPGREAWENLVTVDMNRDVKPDVVGTLPEVLGQFDDDSADELHAYDVLEHIGAQGAWASFFDEFAEYWRLLKPGGLLFAIVPRADSVWAWGDPGHTRVILPQTLGFLSQRIYAEELDGPRKTNLTDYRFIWRGDFEIEGVMNLNEAQLGFYLRAIKPSRWRAPNERVG